MSPVKASVLFGFLAFCVHSAFCLPLLRLSSHIACFPVRFLGISSMVVLDVHLRLTKKNASYLRLGLMPASPLQTSSLLAVGFLL